MFWDDDEDDFDLNDEFSPEENEDNDALYKSDFNIDDHELYKLSNEIFNTVDTLAEYSTTNGYEFFMQNILRSANLLIVKFEDAMHRQSWTNAMECAAIIRYESKTLLAQTGLMENFLGVEEKYIAVLRSELIRFRTLFNDWVMEIQDFEEKDEEDEWGLFLREKL